MTVDGPKTVHAREDGRTTTGAHCTFSTAIDGTVSSVASRIFFAGCCIISASNALSGRMFSAPDSDRLGVPSATDATGDERDDVDADAFGGVVPLVLPLPLLALLLERIFVGSLT